MKINEANGTSINTELNLHDCVFQMFCYKQEEKVLYISALKPEDNSRKIIVKFVDVKGIKMTACDYWGPSPHIFDFEYVVPDNRKLLPELLARKKSEPASDNCLSNPESYIESVITFTSGDQLAVVCQSIVFDE